MATQYFILKPNPIPVIQWTGDNFAEIEAASPYRTLVDNGDGTITSSSQYSGADQINLGGYVSGGVPVSLEGMQQVSSGSVDYVVE